MNTPMRMIGALVLLVVAVPTAAQERYNVSGDHVAIYNLAGRVDVTGASGGSVTVEVVRGGDDASGLDVRVSEIDGRQTLRVLYPTDRLVYPELGRGSQTSLRVRGDGTWGGDGGSWFGGRGDEVRISGSGSGMEAFADLRIGVPRGGRVDVYLAAGRITAQNVDGRVRLDTHGGSVEARSMAGSLLVDTGSGAVDVMGMEGDLEIDTGSGRVRVADVRANNVLIDTGSGRVNADNVNADEIEIDTGSGGIELRRSAGRDVRLDTGSGGVEAELTGDIEELLVDTGSGSVTVWLPENLGARLEIETGSGGIDVDFPVMVSRRARDELRGEIGDGRGSIRIDTGSGSVRLRRL